MAHSTRRPLRGPLALAAVLMAGLAACSSTSSSSSSSASASSSAQPGVASGTLTGAMSSGAIDTMDPNRWYFAVTWGLANAMCTTLVRYADQSDAAGTQLTAGLANMPAISSDGLTYTFTLRPGARFSDGTPITGQDIKYTFLRLMNSAIDTGTGYYFTNVIGAPAYLAGKSSTVAGIVATSNTVTFHLSAPDGAFLYKAALPTTCPVPVGTPMKSQENGNLEMNYASGPYKLQSYQPGRQIVMVFNKNYDQALGVRGHVAKFVFTIGVEASQAALEIQAGQLDFQTSNLATADIIRISHDAALAGQVHQSPRPETTYLFLNNEVAPFNNIDVRKAVNYAINRTAIEEQWGGPLVGSVTSEIMVPGALGYAPYSAYPDTPNLTEAKALMAASGVKLPINTSLRAQNDAPGFINMAEVIKSNLAAIGINVTIVGSPNSVNSSYISNPASHTPMGIEPWSLDFPDAEALINTGMDPATPNAAPNLTRFGDPAFIPAFNAAAAALGTKRAQLYETLDKNLMTQVAPYAPIFNARWYDFVSTRVGGYVYSVAMDAINYNTLYVK
jgi:peptide/nickel transport system substrate-binding protein